MNYKRLLVTDADNTLWETDEVFAAAQLDLLQRVEEDYGVSVPNNDRLKFVREFDQALASRHPEGLKYPVHQLVRSIVSAIQNGDAELAINDALQRESPDPKAEAIANTFVARVLNVIPTLRLGVAKTVPALAQNQIRVVVLTEGNAERCERLLDHHGLRHSVFAVQAEKKTIETYAVLRSRYGGSDRPVMVGDQIDRDIEISKLAGYTTVHFPGGFNPVWTLNRQVVPDYAITSYDQIEPILGVATTADPRKRAARRGRN
jgi:putative hydrolase of the HAD superfamily